jgi:N-acylneuraminate cytidylyltransferase/CMP-N,N'-diacetyllegionaminic acid synthase|tara:strand:- start:648 stop:1343 length:696 start_codon:yes stop_codon:yes gene_type:complete
MTKILCIIPARSGSQGLKDKNIKKIKGKTLIEIACTVARKSKIFEDVIVSTDSPSYLKNVKKLVSNSEYLRPKKLARKNTTDLEVIQYEMKRYSKILKKDYDFVCILQPTSPLRTIEHLIQCLNNIKKSNYDALWTVSRIDRKFNSIKQLVLDNDILKYHHPHGSQFTSRQNLEDTYIRNGVAYFYSFDAIYKYKNVLPKKSGYLIIKDRIVNIDTKEDFDLAKKYFKNIK